MVVKLSLGQHEPGTGDQKTSILLLRGCLGHSPILLLLQLLSLILLTGLLVAILVPGKGGPGGETVALDL